MATHTKIILVDDVDGSEADETVTFGIDGASYEIDLSEGNAEALREALAPWVGHARRVGRRGQRSRAAGRVAKANGKPDLADVRAWARKNGFQVSDRGRVAGDVMAAYDQAH